MLEPRMSESTRAWLERIQAIPMNAAHRAHARAEFEHAEATAERLLGFVGRLRRAVWMFRRTVAVRRQRLG